MDRILIIDADEHGRLMMDVGLTGAGMETLAAGSAVEARRLLKEQTVQAIVSEVDLPDATGFDLIAEFKRDAATADLPMIFVTRRKGVEDKIQGLEIGAQDYLTKPIYLREFVTRVRGHLKKRETGTYQVGSLREQYQGKLQPNLLFDIVQTALDGGRAGRIELRRIGITGILIFGSNTLLDAGVGRLTADAAVDHLLLWDDGDFVIRFDDAPRPSLLRRPTDDLLLNALRRKKRFDLLRRQIPELNRVALVDLLTHASGRPDDLAMSTLFDLFQESELTRDLPTIPPRLLQAIRSELKEVEPARTTLLIAPLFEEVGEEPPVVDSLPTREAAPAAPVETPKPIQAVEPVREEIKPVPEPAKPAPVEVMKAVQVPEPKRDAPKPAPEPAKPAPEKPKIAPEPSKPAPVEVMKAVQVPEPKRDAPKPAPEKPKIAPEPAKPAPTKPAVIDTRRPTPAPLPASLGTADDPFEFGEEPPASLGKKLGIAGAIIAALLLVGIVGYYLISTDNSESNGGPEGAASETSAGAPKRATSENPEGMAARAPLPLPPAPSEPPNEPPPPPPAAMAEGAPPPIPPAGNPDRARPEGAPGAAAPPPSKPDEGKALTVNDWLQKGQAALAARNLAEALRCYTVAVKMAPGRAETHFGLGRVLMEYGRFKPARDAFEAAVEQNVGFAEAWYYLGYCYKMGGSADQARYAYEQFLNLVPSGPRADEVRNLLKGL